MSSYYYYLELALSLLVLVCVHFHYMSLLIHLLSSHYLNCIALFSMLLFYSLLFHRSTDNSMYHLILLLHYMFMHLSHLLYYLLLLHLHVLAHLFHDFDFGYYMSYPLDYLVLLHSLCLPSMFSLHMLYYSFLMPLIHLVLSYTFMLLNYYLLSFTVYVGFPLTAVSPATTHAIAYVNVGALHPYVMLLFSAVTVTAFFPIVNAFDPQLFVL